MLKMQFERGLDPKEAIGVGLKANAPIIGALYRVDIEYEGGWDKQYVSERKTLSIIDSSEVPLILERVSQGIIPLEALAFEQDKPFGVEPTKLEFFTDYRGKYLKYVDRIMSAMAKDEYDHWNQEYIILIP